MNQHKPTKAKQFRPVLSESDLLYLLKLVQKDGTNQKLASYLLQFKFKISHSLVSAVYESEQKSSVEESLGFSSSTDYHSTMIDQIQNLPEEARSDSDWFELLTLKDPRTKEEQTKYDEVCMRLYGFMM